MIDAALIQACAPNVEAETVLAIIRVESGGDLIALATNRPSGAVRLRPRDFALAVALATAEIRRGNSVDIGLMQINSRNLPRLGLTVETVLDPCRNLAAGARILTDAYDTASRKHGDGQGALRAALSAYNTGNQLAGFRNGYVARYYPRWSKPRITTTVSAAVYSANPTVYRRTTKE